LCIENRVALFNRLTLHDYFTLHEHARTPFPSLCVPLRLCASALKFPHSIGVDSLNSTFCVSVGFVVFTPLLLGPSRTFYYVHPGQSHGS
jgi:hypothetical protein